MGGGQGRRAEEGVSSEPSTEGVATPETHSCLPHHTRWLGELVVAVGRPTSQEVRWVAAVVVMAAAAMVVELPSLAGVPKHTLGRRPNRMHPACCTRSALPQVKSAGRIRHRNPGSLAESPSPVYARRRATELGILSVQAGLVPVRSTSVYLTAVNAIIRVRSTPAWRLTSDSSDSAPLLLACELM